MFLESCLNAQKDTTSWKRSSATPVVVFSPFPMSRVALVISTQCIKKLLCDMFVDIDVTHILKNNHTNQF
jgi:hypothetical protein